MPQVAVMDEDGGRVRNCKEGDKAERSPHERNSASLFLGSLSALIFCSRYFWTSGRLFVFGEC